MYTLQNNYLHSFTVLWETSWLFRKRKGGQDEAAAMQSDYDPLAFLSFSSLIFKVKRLVYLISKVLSRSEI